MAYTIYKTNGQFLTTIADGTINRGSTSVALPGRNYSGYGLYIDQDLVQMLENFAGNTVPANPIAGQIWYDTSVPGGVLRVCPADGTLNPADWQEVAVGGQGSNVSFGNISAENITGNAASFIDINAANNIRANSTVNVGSPELITLYGSNGHMQATSANINSITTTSITSPNTSPITSNSIWQFGNTVTFANSVTVNGPFETTAGANFAGLTTLANAVITTLNAGNPNTTLSVSGTTTTFTGTLNATNAVTRIGPANTSTSNVISNLVIGGRAAASPLWGVDTARAGANLNLLATDGTGNLTWANLATYGISSGTTSVVIDGSAGPVRANVNGVANVLVVNSTGANVLALGVTGTTNTSGLSVSGTASLQTTTIGTQLTVTGTANLQNATQILRLGVGTPASATTGEIRATNDITAFYSSDARLKTNVRTIDNALEDLKKIRGVRYDWSDEYIELKGGEDDMFVRRSDVGVIAQEIEQVLPEIVAINNLGYKAVKYERIVSILIEAVKELAEEVQALKSQK